MAWFHHALQEASLPQSPSMKNHVCLESTPRSAIPVAEGQGWPQCLLSSITSYPTASQDMLCLKVGEHLDNSSINQSDGPVPLSYVTLQEQRCVVSWFLGWGPSQRECFLQDLISKAVPGKVCSLLEHLNKLQVIFIFSQKCHITPSVHWYFTAISPFFHVKILVESF